MQNYIKASIHTNFTKTNFMKVILFSILLLASQCLLGQQELSISTNINVDITALDLASAKAALKTFISENKVEIKTQNETKTSISLTLGLNATQYQALRNALPAWGYISSDIINTIDHQEEIEEILIEIDFLITCDFESPRPICVFGKRLGIL